MRIVTVPDGTTVAKADAEKFKEYQGTDLENAMKADAVARNAEAEKLGIKTRYEVVDK